jgi:hypothetical protein
MKFHWSIADQSIQFAFEYLGHKTEMPSFRVPLLPANYFMWGHETKSSILGRLRSLKLSEEQKLVSFVLFMILICVLF